MRRDAKKIPTETKIIDNFIELMRNQPYQKISVSELSKAAGISRITFYTYYKGIDDLYNQVTEKVVQHIDEILRFSYVSKGVVNYQLLEKNLFNYFQKDHSVQVLINNDQTAVLRTKIKQTLVNTVMEHEEISPDDYFSHVQIPFLISGAINVYVDFLNGDLGNVDTKQLMDSLNKILEELS
ncbi:TetR/AcrR family transcriptional regulator [Fructilactobacillus frigidiflavus]|uniref:TetR/AcrR family transcriptional regulator n=1 Tax=Fructilactobacillus frigidiflavus TaxID=3242688 RepID=UPI00375827DF